MSISNQIEKLLIKAEIGKALSRDEIIALLKMPGDYSPDLFATADRVRKNQVGNEIFLRGIIEFSNFCERNCLYCGLRKDNERLSRYRMTDDEILATARQIKKPAFPRSCCNPARIPFIPPIKSAVLIERIKNETGLIITLSIGERTSADLSGLCSRPAPTAICSNMRPRRWNYINICVPAVNWTNGCNACGHSSILGFETGTGNMVGLPGQTPEILADDLLVMKLLDADMLGIGPFIAHPDTPLAGIGHDDLDLTLRVLAVARLLTRNTNIPATTALATLHPQGRLLALQAGANVVMPDFTPEIYKSRYDIYPGRQMSARPKKLSADWKKIFSPSVEP